MPVLCLELVKHWFYVDSADAKFYQMRKVIQQQ